MLAEKGEATSNLFKIEFHPGGAEVIINQIIPHLSRNIYPNDFVVFDGDQNSGIQVDWTTIPTREVTVEKLDESIKAVTGQKVNFLVDGNSGGRQDQKLKLQKLYLEFYEKNTFYFPALTPEQMVWSPIYADRLLTALNVAAKVKVKISREINYKEKFSLLSKTLFNKNDSDTIFTLQTTFVRKFIESKPILYHSTIAVIDSIIELANENDAA